MAREPDHIRSSSGFDKYDAVIAIVCSVVIGVTIWIACGGLS